MDLAISSHVHLRPESFFSLAISVCLASAARIIAISRSIRSPSTRPPVIASWISVYSFQNSGLFSFHPCMADQNSGARSARASGWFSSTDTASAYSS